MALRTGSWTSRYIRCRIAWIEIEGWMLFHLLDRKLKCNFDHACQCHLAAGHRLKVLHLSIHRSCHLLQPWRVPCDLHHLRYWMRKMFGECFENSHLPQDLGVVQHLPYLRVALHNLKRWVTTRICHLCVLRLEKKNIFKNTSCICGLDSSICLITSGLLIKLWVTGLSSTWESGFNIKDEANIMQQSYKSPSE